jgi:hypothetical protein
LVLEAPVSCQTIILLQMLTYLQALVVANKGSIKWTAAMDQFMQPEDFSKPQSKK